MKTKTITFALLLLVGFNLFAQKNQIEAIKKIMTSVDQEEAILEIKNELVAIKDHYEKHKDYDNRFQKAKNMKLLAFSIEEEYAKLIPILDSHYLYLKNNNYYGLANDQCLHIKKEIAGTTYFESPIFKLLGDIKSSAARIIETKEGTSWGSSYFNIEFYQKKLLKKNKYIQEKLKAIIDFQALDESRTTAERKKILDKKYAKEQQKWDEEQQKSDKLDH